MRIPIDFFEGFKAKVGLTFGALAKISHNGFMFV